MSRLKWKSSSMNAKTENNPVSIRKITWIIFSAENFVTENPSNMTEGAFQRPSSISCMLISKSWFCVLYNSTLHCHSPYKTSAFLYNFESSLQKNKYGFIDTCGLWKRQNIFRVNISQSFIIGKIHREIPVVDGKSITCNWWQGLADVP